MAPPNRPQGPNMYGGSADPRTGRLTPMPGYTMPVGGQLQGQGGWNPGAGGPMGATVMTPTAGGQMPTILYQTGRAGNTDYLNMNVDSLDMTTQMKDSLREHIAAMKKVINAEKDENTKKDLTRIYNDDIANELHFYKETDKHFKKMHHAPGAYHGDIEQVKQTQYQTIRQTYDMSVSDARSKSTAFNGAQERLSDGRSPGVLSMIGGNFFSREEADKGGSFFSGIKGAGVVGGGIGLIAGLMLFSRFGIMGYLATAMMTIGFAYGGNKIWEAVRGKDDKKTGPTPTPNLALDGKKNDGVPDLAMKANAVDPASIPPLAGVTGGTNVSNNFQPTMPSTPSVPVKPQANNKNNAPGVPS